MEREKLRTEEIASKSVMERTSLDRSLCKVEEDNADLATKVQNLQAQLAEAEQQHAQRYSSLIFFSESNLSSLIQNCFRVSELFI